MKTQNYLCINMNIIWIYILILSSGSWYLYILILLLILLITYLINLLTKKDKYIQLIKDQQTAKIISLVDEHKESLEKIWNEMSNKEEEKTRQWVESEKETLQVLNGISQILELSDGIKQKELEKILNEILTIKKIISKDE